MPPHRKDQFQPLTKSESNWWKKQRVLVTGASGFKGSWLCSVLAELGAEVHGTVANSIDPESACELLGVRDRIVQYSVDLSDQQQVCDMISSAMPSVIFHLGAKAIVGECLRDPVRAFYSNAMGTLHVLEAVRRLNERRLNCQRLLICSTDHVFGVVDEGEIPVPESRGPRYGGPYETSKAVAELIAQSYYKTYPRDFDDKCRMCITRAANVFGFGDTHSSRIIPRCLRLLNEDNLWYQYTENGRQFLHIADAVSGYILAVSRLARTEAEQQGLSIFHFCIDSYGSDARQNQAGKPEPFIRLKEIVKLIARVGGVKCNEKLPLKKYVENENPVQALRCEDTKQKLKWSPAWDLEQGIRKLLQWYRPKTTRDQSINLITNAVNSCAQRLTRSC